MNINDDIDITSNPENYIGCIVVKTSYKKFKSGSFCNTVKGITNHPILNIPAFTFEEDDSYVECRRCILFDKKQEIFIDKGLGKVKQI